jgi:hypothetical protein
MIVLDILRMVYLPSFDWSDTSERSASTAERPSSADIDIANR